MRRVIAVVLVSLLAATAAAPAGGMRRGGDNRFFAGVGWHHAPQSLGWNAEMRLDKARARDWRRGGYVAMTLWWATNAKFLPYSNSRGRPYVQLALSRGHRGRRGLIGVLSQRTAKGNYHEMTDRTGVNLGSTYAYGVTGSVGGHWSISLRPYGQVAEVRGQGKKPYSSSVFGGIESTSRKNFAKARFDRLAWLVESGHAVTPLPGWILLSQPEYASKRMRHGPGKVRWDEKHRSFDVRFGRKKRR